MSTPPAAADVLVAGAGIIGCSVAWECARRGARVILVDRGRPGDGASGAAAGMLAPLSEAHGPGAFLDMGLAALAAWPAFAAAVESAGGGDCELDLGGLLRVAVDPGDAAAVRGRLAWQRAAGAECEWIEPERLGGLEPALAPGVAGAVLYPGEGQVHGRRAVEALLAALAAAGGEVRAPAGVSGVTPGGAVTLGDGTAVTCGCVVVAAGCWSPQVCAALGVEGPPVQPVRGQLLALRGLERPRHVLFGGLVGYAVGKRDGTVLVGATEEAAGFDAGVTAEAERHLRAVAGRLLRHARAATAATSWAGLRPRTPDGMPVVSELALGGGGRPRVLVATGHHRNGVLLAPTTATAVADLAVGPAARPPGRAIVPPW